VRWFHEISERIVLMEEFYYDELIMFTEI